MRTFISITAFAALLITVRPAAADSGAASTAEMKHDKQSGALLVAMDIPADALQTVLERRAGEKVDIDSKKGTKTLSKYLQSAFAVRTKAGRKLPIQLTGTKLSAASAKIQLQVAVPNGLQGVSFGNRVLFDLEPKQVNKVVFRNGSHKQTYTFHHMSTDVRLDLNK